MPSLEPYDPSKVAAMKALQVLETFAASSGVAFDRIVAARVLGETQQAMGGQDAKSWLARLVEVGESVNLRIRSVECSLREAVYFVREGVPVVWCADADSALAEGSDAAEQALNWLVIQDANARRVLISQLEAGDVERWVSVGELQQELGLKSLEESGRWLIGEAALGCQAPTGPLAPGQSIPPFQRLLGLMLPEKKDLWVVLVFSAIVGLLTLATPIAVEALVNTVAFGRYLQPVIILALLLFTFLAFAAAMRALIAYVVEIIQRRLFIRVVEDLAYRLPRVQQEQFDTKHGPEAVNRFFDVATIQKTASALLLDGISIVLQTVIGMAVLGFYHPSLLGFDVALLAMICLIVFGLGRGAIGTAVKESKAKYAIAAWLQELARHPTAFKMHAGNQFALDRADQLAAHWLDTRRTHFRLVIRQILFALGLQAVAATVLLGLGGWLVILGQLTLGQLVAAELIVMIIVGSFAKLGKHMESFYDLLASVDKLGQLFDLDVESHDKLFHLRDGAPASVRVCDASYSYQGASGIENISLTLEPGERVALAGAAGSGKSTLIDLICGLRSPDTGHVELDGIDLRELRPDSLREQLAVARSVEIFAGTIDENIHLNRTNVRASDVRDALQAVELLDEILKLPDGLNTVLQTNGAPLTQSQAVRLTLARAIVGRPRLLMIDGTLDGLSDDLLERMLTRTTTANSPWSLLIASGRRRVWSACDRVIQLTTNEEHDPELADTLA